MNKIDEYFFQLQLAIAKYAEYDLLIAFLVICDIVSNNIGDDLAKYVSEYEKKFEFESYGITREEFLQEIRNIYLEEINFRRRN